MQNQMSFEMQVCDLQAHTFAGLDYIKPVFWEIFLKIHSVSRNLKCSTMTLKKVEKPLKNELCNSKLHYGYFVGIKNF